jgi:single-strand DNA-binding protein
MLNKAILVGRLTADPELRATPSNVPVTSFRIAIDRPFSSKGGDRQADFITIVAWRATAEFVCRYFKKGSDIAIDGSIQTRDYTDKDGNKRTAVEVVAGNVSFVGRKSSSSPSAENYAAAMPAPAAYASGSAGDFQVIDNDDDLPF